MHYTEDDPLFGLIQDYMDDRRASLLHATVPGDIAERVCSREIYDALPDDYQHVNTKFIITDINKAMQKVEGWKKPPRVLKTLRYGKQRCWVPER